MSNAVDKATELGQAILTSHEYTRYQKCKNAVEQNLLLEKAAIYERALSILNSSLDSDNKLVTDAKSIVDTAKENKILMDYFEAKDKLSFLLDTINQTLAHITGMDAGTAACSGCGGCKGCK